MTARVRGEHAAATVSAVTMPVARSTSAKTGIAPWYRIGVSAPMSVIAVVTISSPGSGSSAATAAWIAAVPELHATAWRRPTSPATRRSSSGVWTPFVAVSVPDSITARSRSSSAAPKVRPLASWSEGSPSGAALNVGSPVPALGFYDRRSAREIARRL